MRIKTKAKISKALRWAREYWYIPVVIIVFIVATILLPKKKKVVHQMIDYMHRKNKRIREHNNLVDKETKEKIEIIEEKKKEIIEKLEEEYKYKKEELNKEKREDIKKELDKVKQDVKDLESWFNDYLS